MTTNTLNLREYWRISFHQWITGENPPNLQAISGRVVYHETDCLTLDRVRVLDAMSGNLVWEEPPRQVCDAPALTADAERVYFANDFKLRAYSLDDGHLLWEQPLPSNVGPIYVIGEKLHMRAYVDRVLAYLTFDTRSGANLGASPFRLADGSKLVAQFPSFNLLQGPDSYQLRAVDAATQQVLWTTDLGDGPVSERPTLYDDTLLFGGVGTLHAVDARTGQIEWHNNDTPSNYVVANGSIYVLDYDARLVRLDIETGQETGYLQFTPAQTNLTENRYWIAADGQMLFVSFGDSQELIALGP